MLRYEPGAGGERPLAPLPEFAGFTQVVEVTNPYATNIKRAVAIGERVMQVVPDGVYAESMTTMPGGYGANKPLFDEHAAALCSPHTLVAAKTGDGGLQQLLQWMLENSAQATVLPLPGGNACDFSTVLLGGRDTDVVSANLRSLRQKSFYPLLCTVTEPEGTVTQRVGHSNWSAAISGRVAHMLNREEVRKHPLAMAHHVGKFAVETAVTLFAAATSRPYTVVISPNHGPQQLRELIVSNLPIMGKVGKFAVRPHEPEAFITAIGRGTNNPLSTAYLSRQLTNGNMYGTVERTHHRTLDDGSTGVVPVMSFVTMQKIVAQMDGEPFYIPSGATVDIAHSQRSIAVLSLAA